MLTTTAGGRIWNFSHAVGRNSLAGNGFTQPTSLALAPGGVIYVASRGQEGADPVIIAENRRIGKVTLDEQFLGDFAKKELTWAAGMAVANDENVYIVDEYLNTINIYNPDGEKIGQWGASGSGEGQMDRPSGIVFDDDDNLYVADGGNNRVQKFTRDGRFLATWGSAGAGEGQFDLPWGITIDRNGDVYVVDWGNNRVQRFSADGEFKIAYGPTDDEALELDHPADVAVDSEGDVYVTDWGNKRVQIYDPEGGVLASLWGDAQEFSSWAKEVIDANPDVVKAYRRVKDLTPLGKFERPVGIAVDDRDRIIVTDSTRGRLQVYTKEKEYLDPQFNL